MKTRLALNVGFDCSLAGGIVCTAVKSGQDISVAEGTGVWRNPNGTGGPTAKAISNVVFCVGEYDTDTGSDGDTHTDTDTDTDVDTDVDSGADIDTDGDAYISGAHGTLDEDGTVV